MAKTKKAAQEGFGLHLTIDAARGRKEKLSDLNLVRRALNDIPKILGLHKIARPQVLWYDGGAKPEDGGVSGIVMIAESHVSIHTFPHKNFFTADVYSCSFFDPDKPIWYLKDKFGLDDLETNVVKRGHKFPRT